MSSSPLLQFYLTLTPRKQVFENQLENWGTGWILIQPADDKEYQKATAYIKNTGECLFGLSKHVDRLKPFVFGSLSFNDMESKYHSFTGEVASRQWAIGQNHRFLRGWFFYCICDCSTVKYMIEYDGCISMVQRWAQELLGYTFFVVHIKNQMMWDVDALQADFTTPLHFKYFPWLR